MSDIYSNYPYRASVTKISIHENVYCDMLIDLFEKETDLYLHF